MVTNARTKVVLNAKTYTLARGRNGERLYEVIPRASQPGDPGGIAYRDWTPWGPDLFSRETDGGYLGREYGDGTDGRWDNLDTLGPELNALTLSTHDATHAAGGLLGSTFILGQGGGTLGGAVSVANCIGMAVMQAASITYGYIARGQIPAKVRLSSMALQLNPPTFTAAATDIIATRAALATTRNEVSVALGDNVAWQSLSEWNVSTADAWAVNTAGEVASIFGQTAQSVAVLTGRTVKQNILTGAVTMVAPNLATVGTLTNDALSFTGFAMDGNLWMVMTSKGPYLVDDETGDFTPIIPELDASTESGRHARNWFPIGTVIPLRDGIRYQKALSGQSWGVERFLGNSSVIQGYVTGLDASTKWLVTALLNEITGVTWLVAWRPRQAGDQHPYPLSPYVIGQVPSSAASRFVEYAGYANGERTLPVWVAGNGSDALWWVDGRTSRFIDDTSYRYITAGTTYLSELYLDGVIGDVEAVELLTASCTANRTVTVGISTDGGSSYTAVGAAITANGFARRLAVSGSAPNITGAYRIKPRLVYASNVATAAPQVISRVRVYWRWRPLELNEYHWTFDLTDAAVGTAEEQQDQLITEWSAAPVLVTEDVDNDSYRVRVNSVHVREIADAGGGATSGATRGTRRLADVVAVEWKVA